MIATDIGIIAPAFVAGLLVLASHVPLGREVLARGIIFLDLAIAQIAGLGVITAYAFGWDAHGWPVQVAAAVAALLGAAILSQLEKHWPEQQEALIGVTFVLAATASILLLAGDVHDSEHLKDLLVGQILWISWEQLTLPAVFTVLIVLAWFGIRPARSHTGFYVLFALAITVSVQLVGIYLVFASLIIPALAALGLTKTGLLAGYAVGAIGYAGGLVLSAAWDLPSGPSIVWCIAAAALLVFIMRWALKRGAET